MPDRKILLVTDNRFWRASMGSHVRILTLYKYYKKKGFEVLVFFVGQLYEPDTRVLKAKFGDMALVNFQNSGSYLPFLPRVLFSLSENLKGLLPLGFKTIIKGKLKNNYALNVKDNSYNQVDSHKFNEPTLADFVRDDYQQLFKYVVDQFSPDVIQVEYLRLSYLLDSLSETQRQNVVKVIDTHDVMHLRKDSFNKRGKAHDINISQEQERVLLSRFDYILAIQNIDKFEFEKMVPDTNVLLVMHPFQITEKNFRTSKVINITYIGASMEPNIDALKGFIKNVWPTVLSECENQVKLNVYGNICADIKQADHTLNIELHGFVEQIDDVYRDTDIVINPVMYGGGLKIKNVEALCNSLPLVTTSVGAEGMEDNAGVACLICDDYQDMAKNIISLINSPDKRTELSKSAFEYAYRHFREEVVYNDLYQVLAK